MVLKWTLSWYINTINVEIFSSNFWFMPRFFLNHCKSLLNLYPAEFSKWTCPDQLSCLELSIINFGEIKIRIWSWSANSVEPGQIARMCRLALLYTGGKGLISFGPNKVRIKKTTDIYLDFYQKKIKMLNLKAVPFCMFRLINPRDIWTPVCSIY